MKKGAATTFLSFPFLSLLLSSPWKGEMVVCKSTQLKLEPPKELLEEKDGRQSSEKERIVRTRHLGTEMMLNQKQDLIHSYRK